jgi:hypothetical protein
VMSVLWPLSDEKRKWLGHRQTDAIDPKRHWARQQPRRVSSIKIVGFASMMVLS